MTTAAIISAPPGLTRSRLSAVYGNLSEPEALALAENIRLLGVQAPILVDLAAGEVLDGWHRYIEAHNAGVSCPALNVAGLSVGQRIALVEAGNAHRRHSSAGHLVKAVIDTRLEELGPAAVIDTQALADTYGLTRRRVQQLAAQARKDQGWPDAAGDDEEQPPPPPTVEQLAQEQEVNRLLTWAAGECRPTLDTLARELPSWGPPGKTAARRVVAAAKALGIPA